MKIDQSSILAFLQNLLSGKFEIELEEELHGQELLSASCPHMHKNWELKFVPLQGSDEGCGIVVVSPGLVHATSPCYFFSVEISHYSLRIGHLGSPDCLRFFIADEDFKLNTLPELLAALIKIGGERRFLSTRKKLMSAILQHLFDLLELLHRSIDTRGTFKPLSKALEYIQHNYYISSIEVKDIADFAGVSAQYLNRICMSEKGASLRQLLIKERLSKAYELLLEDKYYIKEIARITGWNCPAYFSNCFRKHYGCYPTQVKEQR